LESASREVGRVSGNVFKFYPTIDNPYSISVFPRFMLNFSSKRWKNRQKPLETDKEWILDSGGFNELGRNGEYDFSVDEYLEQVRFLNPSIFVTMDWMCEKSRREKTGLSVEKHIDRTVDNACEILNKWNGEADPMVVIQGWDVKDYIYCVERMKDQDCLTNRVGIGSICREGDFDRVKNIILKVSELLPSVKLHGFGIKRTFLKDKEIVDALYSSDSFAWSLTNQHKFDFRGKDRREFLGVWAREVELTAWRTTLNEKKRDKLEVEKLEAFC